jgi:hypothetical protein
MTRLKSTKHKAKAECHHVVSEKLEQPEVWGNDKTNNTPQKRSTETTIL